MYIDEDKLIHNETKTIGTLKQHKVVAEFVYSHTYTGTKPLNQYIDDYVSELTLHSPLIN